MRLNLTSLDHSCQEPWSTTQFVSNALLYLKTKIDWQNTNLLKTATLRYLNGFLKIAWVDQGLVCNENMYEKWKYKSFLIRNVIIKRGHTCFRIDGKEKPSLRLIPGFISLWHLPAVFTSLADQKSSVSVGSPSEKTSCNIFYRYCTDIFPKS